ncbi:hypothetical protein N658DRAFT_517255 [Parathielavia hyrcaniae]|uniref:Zn(2)-C6 fungal-type domain-containing protein n=1 Tax=Parathielavia hyrcaniae TaxID=113614 RepID=A0AAN6PX26_9PEZI|nr:hypothetical protein N658DRAFT_517255 [Parathielavia hyrcaniae]
MAETSPNSAEFFSAGDHHQTDRPRKRPRKGTKSCWECKRRKVRCILAAPGDAVCNECRRRGTACVGQDLPDPPQGSGSSQRRAVEDRLGRLEALVETLVEHLVSKTSTSGAGNPRDSSSTGLAPILALQNGPSSKYDRLSQRLSAAWPDQHDLDLFLDGLDDMGTLGYQLYKAGCLPCDGAVPPRGILRLPPPGSHPILMARKLLLLSMVLQGAMLHPAQEATGATNKPKWHGIMSRVVDAAGLVTVNDELAGCVEGVECLFMESMYHDAVGSLHRASLAIRRAVTMAQMLGLHRGSSITGMAPHSDSGEVDVRQLWFRLVQADRYISFVLGLPQGFCVDDVFATPQALEASPPAERMRRLDVVAAGLILQRKASDMHNTGATLEIDKLLQQSAAGLPSQWWRPVNLAVFRPGHDSPGVLDEVMRIMDQLVHFHLLAQLHLPYLLHPAVNAEDSNNNNNNNQSMYNKLTAINACRDLLTRFISFHQAADSSIAHYCRGASLLAFIAASTLCLAHLEASSRPKISNNDARVIKLVVHSGTINRVERR